MVLFNSNIYLSLVETESSKRFTFVSNSLTLPLSDGLALRAESSPVPKYVPAFLAGRLDCFLGIDSCWTTEEKEAYETASLLSAGVPLKTLEANGFM